MTLGDSSISSLVSRFLAVFIGATGLCDTCDTRIIVLKEKSEKATLAGMPRECGKFYCHSVTPASQTAHLLTLTRDTRHLGIASPATLQIKQAKI